MVSLSEVKAALGIRTSAIDDELIRLISTAITDLDRLGVDTSRTTTAGSDDMQVNEAIILYVGWMRNVEGRANDYQQMYYRKASALSMSDDYRLR